VIGNYFLYGPKQGGGNAILNLKYLPNIGGHFAFRQITLVHQYIMPKLQKDVGRHDFPATQIKTRITGTQFFFCHESTALGILQ
jgi:hypothetical protein